MEISNVGTVGTLVGQKLKPIHIANKRENIFIAITKHYLIQSLYTANLINLKTEKVRNFNKYYKEVKLSLQYNNMLKLCMKNIYLLLI